MMCSWHRGPACWGRGQHLARESGSPEVSLSPFPSVIISVSCHVSLSHPNMSQFSVISALSLSLISLLHPPCSLSVLSVCLPSATCHPPISPSPPCLHAHDSLYLSADTDLYLSLSFLRCRCLCPVPVCLCLCPSVPVSLHLVSVPVSSVPHNLKSQLMAALSPGCPVMLLYKADARSPHKETSLAELVAAPAAGRRA